MSTNTLALIFDFDDTLTDDSTTKLLEKHGIDTKDFWRNKADTLVRDQGWDPTFAYLHLLLSCIEDKTLPALTNVDLFAFGKTLKPYAGLQDLLKDLRKIAHSELFDIEYYIISGGCKTSSRASSCDRNSRQCGAVNSRHLPPRRRDR